MKAISGMTSERDKGSSTSDVADGWETLRMGSLTERESSSGRLGKELKDSGKMEFLENDLYVLYVFNLILLRR